MNTRIEPCESFGKHVLEIYVAGRWQTLCVDYLSALNGMKLLIEQALITPPSDGVELVVEHHISGGTMMMIADKLVENLDAVDGDVDACPCVLADQPCKPDCSCLHEYSSAGCRCCARYGSDEQRKHAANLIVQRMQNPNVEVALAEALEKLVYLNDNPPLTNNEKYN